MTDTTPFGQLLQTYLRRSNQKQADLARAIGCKPQLVSQVKRGIKPPPFEEIDRWARALGLDPEERQYLRDMAAVAHMPEECRDRFATLLQREANPMRSIRGTLILADQVYRDERTRKFIISGAYSHWNTNQDVIHTGDFHFYLRIQVEHPGTFPCRILCVDKVKVSTEKPIWDVGFDLSIPKDGLPVFEAGFILPAPTVQAPVPFRDREPGKAYGLRTLIWFQVAGEDVASCPLDYIFHGPPQWEGGGDDGHSNGQGPA